MDRKMKSKFLVLALVSCAAFSGAESQAKNSHNDVCDIVMQVKVIPFRTGEKGFDRNYDRLFGDSIVADQIVDCITDVRLMPDPRMMPDKVNEFRVGDAAYMIFVGKSRLKFEDFLPENVGQKVRRDGARYYFDWVNKRGNRVALRNAVLKGRKNGKPTVQPKK